MPTVKRQDFFLVSPELKTVIRGQSKSFALTLHRGVIGQPVDLNQIDNLEITITDSNGNVVKTASTKLNTIPVGTGPNRGQFQITIDGTDVLNVASGDLDLSVILTEQQGVGYNKITQFPKLRLAIVRSSDDTLPDGSIPGRFVTPNVIYSIRSFDANTDKPVPGQIVLNSDVPSFVNKIIFNNTDDLGKRNVLLEQTLIKRFEDLGTYLDITLTNVNNPGEYATYKVVSYSRVNVTDLDPNSMSEYGDAIELTVIPVSNSRDESIDLKFVANSKLGLTLDIYANNSIIVNDNQTKKLIFTGGATVTNNPNDITVAIPNFSGGVINGVDGTSGTSGVDGTPGAEGAAGPESARRQLHRAGALLGTQQARALYGDAVR